MIEQIRTKPTMEGIYRSNACKDFLVRDFDAMRMKWNRQINFIPKSYSTISTIEFDRFQ